MRQLIRLLALAAAAGAGIPASAAASAALDEMKPQILEEISELKKHVEGNDVPAARGSVDLIDAWLGQVQAQDVTSIFLDVEGFTKEVGEAQSMTKAMFGGGVTASCRFTRGDITVDVDIVGNSPMLGMISGMMGMAVASGKKVIKVAGNKALVDDSGGRVEVQVPFESAALVTAKGPDLENTRHVLEKGVAWDRLGPMMQP